MAVYATSFVGALWQHAVKIHEGLGADATAGSAPPGPPQGAGDEVRTALATLREKWGDDPDVMKPFTPSYVATLLRCAPGDFSSRVNLMLDIAQWRATNRPGAVTVPDEVDK
eukprot:Sspe_Gene.97392::Locus_70987_Transcript_1_1_Confidence_1.000_Length_414::g.97392::m.97392